MTEQKIMEVLSVLAAKFATTTEHLYGVLVRQAYVEGWLGAVTLAVFIIILVVGSFAGYVLIKMGVSEYKSSGIYGSGDGAFIGGILIALATNLVCWIVVCAAAHQTTYIINPEFGAIKTVIELAK